ncbi:MAG: DNA methyltransferase [Castellaniella sp.]
MIAKTKAKDSALGAELDREFKILSSRLPFGLNFERHSPEAVELPLRPIRKGDKVRVLPERGSTKKGGQRLWHVKTLHKTKKAAVIELLGAAGVTQTVTLDELVVVAEFRDTIYLDPPYNSGAKDWKYNNDYVEKDDSYRHSKWLAMMERRLSVAKELLNPADSVLIVTIDEKEVHRLSLLLEQILPEAKVQMITSVISQNGIRAFTRRYSPGAHISNAY